MQKVGSKKQTYELFCSIPPRISSPIRCGGGGCAQKGGPSGRLASFWAAAAGFLSLLFFGSFEKRRGRGKLEAQSETQKRRCECGVWMRGWRRRMPRMTLCLRPTKGLSSFSAWDWHLCHRIQSFLWLGASLYVCISAWALKEKG